jgi:predicted acetylornithine/succinylornithine family transaminase
MTTQQIMESTDQHIMRTYGRLPVAFVRGEGCRLWDAEGNEWLDFVGGLAVCSQGHCHPKVVAAIREQAGLLIHTSNLYHIGPQAELGAKLCAISFADKCFFCNSGAEANEAAIKLARKYAKLNVDPGKYEIITARGSFHGRTLTTITATGQEKYQKHFDPLVPGFSYVDLNDLDGLRAAVGPQTAAIMLEPIQGEIGVKLCTREYLQGVRALCDEQGMLLIFDEVQCGLARTGKWFAYEHFGVEPDIMTLAKALGGGVPIGACLATDRVAAAFQPGDHASTFGGNFLACAAALAALEAIEEDKLVERASEMGEYMTGRLTELQGGKPVIGEVRGRGLMLAIELREPRAREVQQRLFGQHILVNAIGETIVRFVPPLVVTREECDRVVVAVAAALD